MSCELGGKASGACKAYPNSGLESLAFEASRRAESLEADLDYREKDLDAEPKSPNSKGKVRKAYTITKQRERWTEEEHDRFLQALKRYGRAWRKIEEHIGTKTAVQIRSHAQKFFSKLQREQSLNGGRDESSKNDISIPPPRPKRKPMHPYPRNSVDNPSEPLDQSRSSQYQHQPNPSTHQKEGKHVQSTQGPMTHRYSSSSGHQSGHDMLGNHSFFQQHPTPFAGSLMSPQSSQVQLPPFPSLDTSGGENMTKVLKDAAMAAASAWNRVVSGASKKVQNLIQAQSFQPPMQGVNPMWPSQQMEKDQNALMRQLLQQAAQHPSVYTPQAAHETDQALHGQPLYGRQASTTTPESHRQDTFNSAGLQLPQGQQEPMLASAESNRDSACSKDAINPKLSQSAFKPTQSPAYWSKKNAYSVSEAKLGRSAWEMMNRVTAQKSRELLSNTKTEELSSPQLMQAPSTGASNASRRIMKPIAHSARISPLPTDDPTLATKVCSDTSQLAQYYQRAAAKTNGSLQSPVDDRNNVSRTGENGSGHKRTGSAALDRNGSNTETASDEGKDQQSSGADRALGPKSRDLASIRVPQANAKKQGIDELRSNGGEYTKGSDKGSNNGNGSGSSDEDALLNGSELNTTGNEEKGSNEGSNSDEASPRETTPGPMASQPAQKELEKDGAFAQRVAPQASEASWAAASLQNLQRPSQDGTQQPPSQAEMVQQILPFTLTRDQHAAISTWAAANAQSQPQQFQFMQSLLTGLTNQGPDSHKANDLQTAQGCMDRQISSLTSHDTGSNTNCNIANGLGLSPNLESRKSTAGDLMMRPSGFQPYNKRTADSSIILPPTKRVAAASLLDQPSYKDSQRGRILTESPIPKGDGLKRTTPFGTQAVQSWRSG